MVIMAIRLANLTATTANLHILQILIIYDCLFASESFTGWNSQFIFNKVLNNFENDRKSMCNQAVRK